MFAKHSKDTRSQSSDKMPSMLLSFYFAYRYGFLLHFLTRSATPFKAESLQNSTVDRFAKSPPCNSDYLKHVIKSTDKEFILRYGVGGDFSSAILNRPRRQLDDGVDLERCRVIALIFTLRHDESQSMRM